MKLYAFQYPTGTRVTPKRTLHTSGTGYAYTFEEDIILPNGRLDRIWTFYDDAMNLITFTVPWTVVYPSLGQN